MLTIPEEFLLLTLKDDSGSFVYIHQAAIRAGFIGAAVMELAIQDRIDSDLERAWVVDATPVGEPCVDFVLEKLADGASDLRAVKLIDTLAGFGDHVRGLALERLCERKILAKTDGRLFWFLKSRRYPVVDGREIREAKLRLLDVLLRDEVPAPRDICLMALADTCGLIQQIVPVSELTRASERLAILAKMDLIGQNVALYIRTWLAEELVHTSYL